MKKFLAIILTICLMSSVFCITAFATDEAPSNILLRISALKDNGDTVEIESHDNLEKGWNSAMSWAKNETKMKTNGYSRIIIDLYADWNVGDKGGVFGDGDGFEESTISFPKNARVTLNMNGHTINRGLVKWEHDGEVMYINKNANIIIKDGTITGGWSCNGAGGIHINDGANVTLENVNIVGNRVDDDDGAGIAMYDGATLTMTGGCISNNTSYGSTFAVYGGGVYINDSRASFTNVTFENNQGVKRSTHGAAIYVDNSTLNMDNCLIVDNGLYKKVGDVNYVGAYTIIDITTGSNVAIKNGTKFLNNGAPEETQVNLTTKSYTSVIRSTASLLNIDTATFNNNNQTYLIDANATMLDVSKSDFTNNKSLTLFGNCANIYNNTFDSCRFSYSEPLSDVYKHNFNFNTNNSYITFLDCDFGEATFNDRSRATFIDTNSPAGSIFGEGSITMIFALIALVASIASMGISIALYKKKAAPTAKAKAAEDEE